MFSGSDVERASSEVYFSASRMRAIFNNVKSPLLADEKKETQLRNLNNLPTLQDVLNDTHQLDDLINKLELPSSYRRLALNDVVSCVGYNSAIITAMVVMVAIAAGLIYLLSGNDRFHARRRYASELMPGGAAKCHDTYPLRDYWDYRTNTWDDPTGLSLYCYDKYDYFYHIAVLCYFLTICGSITLCVGMGYLVALVGMLTESCAEKLDKSANKLEMQHLKSQFRNELNEICLKYRIIYKPEHKPADLISVLDSQLCNRNKFFRFVEQTRDTNSFLSVLPPDIALLVAACADLTDKKTKATVIKHSLRDARNDRLHFTSAFYAPNETAASFDAKLSAVALAAAPAKTGISDAIVEPEFYEGLRRAI